MSSFITEDDTEQAILKTFEELGFECIIGPEISHEGVSPERESYQQVLLVGRLRDAVARLNPELPAGVVDDVVRKVASPSPVRISVGPKLQLGHGTANGSSPEDQLQ